MTSAAGFDAIAHAVETAVTKRRTPISTLFSHEAFRLLNANYERVIAAPHDIDARGAMLLGAFYAGLAIEQSMLGAAHACANPLTARYHIAHGVALAILLPHVVRWNARADTELYNPFVAATMNGAGGPGSDRLAEWLVRIGRCRWLSQPAARYGRAGRQPAVARRRRQPAMDRGVQPANVQSSRRPGGIPMRVLTTLSLAAAILAVGSAAAGQSSPRRRVVAVSRHDRTERRVRVHASGRAATALDPGSGRVD